MAALLVLALPAYAGAEQEWFNYEHRGQLANETAYTGLRLHSKLNRGNQLLGLAEISNRAFGDLEVKLFFGDWIDVTVRDRAIYLLDDGGTDSLDNTVEEAYVVVRFLEDSILELGRRNIREGVGYSFNPVDFLRTPIDLAGTDPDPAKQREHRPGNYLINVRGEIGPMTVSGVYSPQLRQLDGEGTNQIDQFLLKGYSPVQRHDISLYLYRGTRWKGGASWATVLGQALELHGEASLQRGSDVEVPVTFGSGPVPLFRFERRDADDALFARVLVGGQYTFQNGINVIGEYYYNGDGYTDSEFHRYFRLLDVASARQQDSRFTLPTGENAFSLILLDAANNLEFAQGQHVLFGRLSGLGLPGRVDVVAFDMLSLQDASNLASVELSRGWGNLRTGIAYDDFSGSQRSQLGSLPVRYNLRWFVKYFF